MENELKIVKELHDALLHGILDRWYPLTVDKECGGYYTNISCDWKIMPQQEKMIVSQARHIWTLSKASEFLGGAGVFDQIASHGFEFMTQSMWDSTNGGFYQIRSREGKVTDVKGWLDEKRAYGNAFALYAMAALFGRTRSPQALEWAKKTFYWIENHAHDERGKGYFQFLTPESAVFDRNSAYKTIAFDSNELGFKDQNSSIHLMEAYTELHHVWKDELLHSRLKELLELIRDVMVTDPGYLQLFFENDWKPVSFRHASDAERKANFGLDHISFGHDYETAFLMLEASFALGVPNDFRTLTTAKKMLDHALLRGWDPVLGGFYDGGYYDKDGSYSVVLDTKNWWAQAEGLNALLLFSKIFPEDQRYASHFIKQWEYIKSYIIDPVNGDWFEGGIDKEPQFRSGQKSHMWKCTYHTSRALMNCIALLRNDEHSEIHALAAYWRKTAEQIR
jgi:mannobiose 2-epimerase